MIDAPSLYIALLCLCLIERIQRISPTALLAHRGSRSWQLQRVHLYPGNGTWGWVWTPLTGVYQPSFVVTGTSLDVSDSIAVWDQIDKFLRQTRSLRVAATVLAATLFIALPAVVLVANPRQALLPLMATIAFEDALVALLAWRWLRRWSNRSKFDAVLAALRYCVYPPAALMAPTDAANASLGSLSIVTAAFVLGNQRMTTEILREQWVYFRFERPTSNSDSAIQVLQRLATSRHIAWDQIAGPPKRQDPSCLSYCPRCLSQFRRQQHTCPDCTDVVQVSFDE